MVYLCEILILLFNMQSHSMIYTYALSSDIMSSTMKGKEGLFSKIANLEWRFWLCLEERWKVYVQMFSIFFLTLKLM